MKNIKAEFRNAFPFLGSAYDEGGDGDCPVKLYIFDVTAIVVSMIRNIDFF